MTPPPDLNREKYIAAKAAVEMVQSGMIVGLGTGSTAEIAIKLLAEKIQSGLVIQGIPTSTQSRSLALSAGIPLTDFSVHPIIDLTIDGADRFDSNCRLIKGGGGALLHEKIIAHASRQLIIIADSGKHTDPLGGFPLPLEIIPLAVIPVSRELDRLGLRPQRRRQPHSEKPFITDEGNAIIDLHLQTIDSPENLALTLQAIPGIVEHGLFLKMAHLIFMGQGDHVITFRP